MTLTNFSTDSAAAPAVPAADFHESAAARESDAVRPGEVVDRRASRHRASTTAPAGRERRQFGSSHAELSEQGRELAAAIDRYKLQHHRRYITCDEMLSVLRELGYSRNGNGT